MRSGARYNFCQPINALNLNLIMPRFNKIYVVQVHMICSGVNKFQPQFLVYHINLADYFQREGRRYCIYVMRSKNRFIVDILLRRAEVHCMKTTKPLQSRVLINQVEFFFINISHSLNILFDLFLQYNNCSSFLIISVST